MLMSQFNSTNHSHSLESKMRMSQFNSTNHSHSFNKKQPGNLMLDFHFQKYANGSREQIVLLFLEDLFRNTEIISSTRRLQYSQEGGLRSRVLNCSCNNCEKERERERKANRQIERKKEWLSRNKKKREKIHTRVS